MIERELITENLKEFQIQEYITLMLKNLGLSHIKLQKTPMGEKIIIYASRPGLVVGKKGQNIKKLTENLKKKFKLENPQIEISEVKEVNLDPHIVAERISNSLEKFGSQRFKGIGHKVMTDVMNSGAMGVEIVISGKIPSSRAKNWRFYQGYLKKCGDVALTKVKHAQKCAELKTGTIGIKVKIMLPKTILPDKIKILEEPIEIIEEIKEKKEKPKKKPAKRVKKEKTKETKK